MRETEKQFQEALAVVDQAGRFVDGDLPDIHVAMRDASPRKKRALRRALEIAKSVQGDEDLSEELFSEMTACLVFALPDGWPAGWSSFSHYFHASAHGERPVRLTMNLATGETTAALISPKPRELND